MSRRVVLRYTLPVDVVVEIDVDGTYTDGEAEDRARDEGYRALQDYANTIWGGDRVIASALVDGNEPYEVTQEIHDE